jgi:hypothetical protein
MNHANNLQLYLELFTSMVVHTCNPSTLRWANGEFKAHLGSIAKACLKKKKKREREGREGGTSQTKSVSQTT